MGYKSINIERHEDYFEIVTNREEPIRYLNSDFNEICKILSQTFPNHKIIIHEKRCT